MSRDFGIAVFVVMLGVVVFSAFSAVSEKVVEFRQWQVTRKEWNKRGRIGCTDDGRLELSNFDFVNTKAPIDIDALSNMICKPVGQ